MKTPLQAQPVARHRGRTVTGQGEGRRNTAARRHGPGRTGTAARRAPLPAAGRSDQGVFEGAAPAPGMRKAAAGRPRWGCARQRDPGAARRRRSRWGAPRIGERTLLIPSSRAPLRGRQLATTRRITSREPIATCGAPLRQTVESHPPAARFCRMHRPDRPAGRRRRPGATRAATGPLLQECGP